MDLEQKAIERIRLASDLSLKHYNKPLVCEYSGGKDSDVLLELFRMSGIPLEVHNSHTTVDAPQTVRHIKNTFSELTDKGIKCEIDYHVQENGNRLTMWNLIPRKLMPPTRIVRYCCPELKEGGNPNRMIEERKRRGKDVKWSCGEEVYLWWMLKDFPAEYRYLLSSAALSACPKNTVIVDMVIENILHRKSYRKISKERYIPMNPKDFYGYRRKAVAVLYERMRLLGMWEDK